MIQLNIEEYIICTGVSLVSVRPVDNDGEYCDEVAFNRVALSTFAIIDSVKDVVSLCRFIMDLDRHSPW